MSTMGGVPLPVSGALAIAFLPFPQTPVERPIVRALRHASL